MGLEVYYPDYSRSLIKRYLEIAAQNHLLVTGGSDFHGPRTMRSALGSVAVPPSVIEDLEAARTRL